MLNRYLNLSYYCIHLGSLDLSYHLRLYTNLSQQNDEVFPFYYVLSFQNDALLVILYATHHVVGYKKV